MSHYSFAYGYGQEDYFPGSTPDISCAPGSTPVVVDGAWTCKKTQISCAKGKPVLVNGLWRCSEDVEVKNWGSCYVNGVQGTCQATSKQCNGSYRAGVCPGPANVQCCLPATAPTPTPPKPRAAEPVEEVVPELVTAGGGGGGGGGLLMLAGVAAVLFLFARKR
jgi:hypothetical protein